jgi:hypothetical protein
MIFKKGQFNNSYTYKLPFCLFYQLDYYQNFTKLVLWKKERIRLNTSF